MNRYPQCHLCKLNSNGVCKHDGKPIKADSMRFTICKHRK